MSVFRINKSPDEERSDKGLRDKLNNHAVTPPSYIWDNVEENLPQQRKRRGIIFWLLPLAACMAGLVAFLYIGLPENALPLTHKQEQNEIALSKNNTPNQANKEKQKSASAFEEPNKPAFNQNNNNTSPENAAATSKIVTGQKPENNTKPFFGNSIYADAKTKSAKNSTNNKVINNHLNLQSTDYKTGTKNNNTLQPGFLINENKNGIDIAGTGNQSSKLSSNPDSVTETTTVDSISKNLAENMTEQPAGKNNPNVKGPKVINRWAIGMEGGLGYAYRFIPSTKSDVMMDVEPGPVSINNSNTNYNEVESAGISWKSGLNISYNLNDNWSLSTGISYTQASILSKINAEITYREDSNIGSNYFDTVYIQKNSTGEFSYGSLDGSNVVARASTEKTITRQNNVKYTFSYIDIPLQVQYRSTAKKAAWFVQAGPSAHFLATKKAVYTINNEDNSIQLGKTYNTFAISANVYSGISIPLKKFDLQFGPSFNYWFTSLMPTTPKAHLYTTQLKGAIYYKF